MVAYSSIVTLFLGGELDRRDQEAPFGKTQLDPLKRISVLKIPFIITGCVLATVWLILYWNEVLENLEAISSNWIPISVGGLLVAVSSWTIIKWHTRKADQHPAIV
jgi:amino acid permease